MTTATRLLDVARSQLGVAIDTPGVPYAVRFSCAKFTSWCYEQVGLTQYEDESPSVQMGIFDHAGRFGPTPQPGDQIFVDLTGQGRQALHTGFVDTVNADGTLSTIEFNAPDGGPNTVKYHTRQPVGDGYTLGFGHPDYITAAAPFPSPASGGTTNVYLGVGHGMEPNGVFDPGAHNDADGTNEYDLNFVVTDACHTALSRSRVPHLTETSAGRGHDVDYRGAVDAINAGSYDLAVEIHFDSADAPDDVFGIYVSDAGRHLTDLLEARMRSVGLATKPSYKDVRGLYFIEGTKCPAVIVECGAVHHRDPDVLKLAGELIAAAICDYFGVAYAPPALPSPAPTPPVVIDIPGDNVKLIKIPVSGTVGGKQVSTDDKGWGNTIVPGVSADRFANAWPNGAGYLELPQFHSTQDEGGQLRINWKGAPLSPPFEAHVLVTD